MLSTEWKLALYIAIGYGLNSALHTWYATHAYSGSLRFGLPISEQLSWKLPVYFGYIGAGLVALVALAASGWLLRHLPPIEHLTTEGIVSILPRSAIVIVALLLLSQLLAGATWSKLALDCVLFLGAGLVLLSVIDSVSTLGMLGLYVTISFGLFSVAATWIEFTSSFNFPHFPSFAYFAVASAYAVIGSATLSVTS